MDKPLSYYAFEMLYWCGIREGELLALTKSDFDFEKGQSESINPIKELKVKISLLSPKRLKATEQSKCLSFV